MREFSDDNNDQPSEPEVGTPKFGRLLVVLALAVLIIVAVTFLSEAYLA